MMLETFIKLCVTGSEFLQKKFLHQNWGKGPKIGFFEFAEKFGH